MPVKNQVRLDMDSGSNFPKIDGMETRANAILWATRIVHATHYRLGEVTAPIILNKYNFRVPNGTNGIAWNPPVFPVNNTSWRIS